MENGWKWTLAASVAIIFGAMLMIGAGHSGAPAKTAVPQKVATVQYPKPVVEVEAQPMLAALDDSSAVAEEPPADQPEPDRHPRKRRHHSHSHHRKASTTGDLGADPYMGFMKADDSKAEDTNDWTPETQAAAKHEDDNGPVDHTDDVNPPAADDGGN